VYYIVNNRAKEEKAMSARGVTLRILLCGMLLSAATPLCHAREPAKLFDVKMPQTRMSSAAVPNRAISSPPAAEPVKPAGEAPKKSWFRRLLEGIVTSAAKFNTERQDDGRPQPANNSR
jgi:hypothetical protein